IQASGYFLSFVFVSDVQRYMWFFFFFDPATPEIYSLSLHDALPIFDQVVWFWFAPFKGVVDQSAAFLREQFQGLRLRTMVDDRKDRKSTTSELQSRSDIVCRLLLEKKNGCSLNGSSQRASKKPDTTE